MKPYLGFAAVALAALGGIAAPAGADPRPSVVWSGDVDDTTIVYVHEHDVRTRDVSGKGSRNVSSEVFGRLPRGPIQVFLDRREGRGRIRIIQQPRPDNDFTAAVRIQDPQSGRGHYSFSLRWNGDGGRVFRGAGDNFNGLRGGRRGRAGR